MFEQYALIIIVAGLLIVLIGLGWLIVRAFRTRFWWGLGLLLFMPLSLWYMAKHWARAALPTLVIVIGLVIAAAPYAVSAIREHLIDLGPHETREADGLHLTLTGWDQTDYSVLRARRDAVVLQMANADVTDATLEHLREFKQLKELDVSNTQVTDSALAILKELPALRTLRLRKTQITDEGFREHLMQKDELMELDARETKVKSSTMREWRKLKEGRRGTP